MRSYEPIDPADTPAFQVALRDHRYELIELLAMAEGLQQLAWDTMNAENAQSAEVLMAQVEIALGCGSKAAVVCVQMAGFQQAKDGRWYTSLAGDCVVLKVGQSFLKDLMVELADSV